MAVTDALQDDAVVRELMKNQERLQNERAVLEPYWRAIDERVNVLGGGSFDPQRSFYNRGQHNFDATAVEGLDRFAAALAAITTPHNQQYIGLKFADKDLNKLPSVKRWCERASDRLYAIRYASHAGFRMMSDKDVRQTGAYGTAPLAVQEWAGVGLFYKAIHLGECWIDEDFRDRVDTVHRKFKKTVRQLKQQYGEDGLSPKMRDNIKNDKWDVEYEIMTVVRPNRAVNQDKFDWRGKPIESIHIALDEKYIMRRMGFHSMPIMVSRDVLGSGDKYGRSPAMKVFGTILGVNQMQKTNIRAAHKAVDPALAFYSDDGISSVITKPGGMNPSLMSENGNIQIGRIPGGEQGIPVAMEMVEGERKVIRTAFLEDFFRILTDPGDRMTATQVLEMVAKQGVLVGPYAGRYETEKSAPQVDRELDLALRAGQIDPLPDEVREAGAWPKAEYDNLLSKMARAQDAAGLTRLIETMAPMAQNDPHIYDWINEEEAVPGVADVLSVRPSWVRSKDEVAAIRKNRSEQEAASQGVDQLATAAGAYKDLAAANAQTQGASAA